MLLVGCAMVPAYSTPEMLQNRERCLRAGGVWIETMDVYVCRPLAQDSV